MAQGGQVKGYAAGGMPDFGNGYNPFANLPPMSGPLGAVSQQLPAGSNVNTDGIGLGKYIKLDSTIADDFTPKTMGRPAPVTPDLSEQGYRSFLARAKFIGAPPTYEQWKSNIEQRISANAGGSGAMLPQQPTVQPTVQPTGQSMFPGATSMQGGFGQGAPGYPSLTMGSGGSGGFSGGSGGPFPLEGRYGIVKMNTGGALKNLPKGDAGVYRDTDPTTAKQDAFTAALTRMKAIQSRANIKGLPGIKAAAKPLGNVEEAAGGGMMSSIGGYSDGGRMLKGPGDGMSDSIPGIIGGKQPARLADGEFVVPADVVSHLGNGSTDAGARKLYKMMDKIRKARTGKKKQAPAVKADKYLPA
jgi:hypothetical protein